MKILGIILIILIEILLINVLINFSIEAVSFIVAITLLLSGIIIISHFSDSKNKSFLIWLFFTGFMIRVVVAIFTYYFNFTEYLAPDTYTYDLIGSEIAKYWHKQIPEYSEWVADSLKRGRGFAYVVGIFYYIVGNNLLAFQIFNSALGALNSILIFWITKEIFNQEVAKRAALLTMFFPSLILWSSQGMKEPLVIFSIILSIFSVLKLQDKFSFKYIFLIIIVFLIIRLTRKYILFVLIPVTLIVLFIGRKNLTINKFVQQTFFIILFGLLSFYLGGENILLSQSYMSDIPNLETISNYRRGLTSGADSSFATNADISSPTKAITFLPIGFLYLMLAPFPWDMVKIRQLITLPEMLIWWGLIPYIFIGIKFSIKQNLRKTAAIILFLIGLTLGYSLTQGNVGTAYRQRSQLIMFFLIFGATGWTVVKNKHLKQPFIFEYEEKEDNKLIEDQYNKYPYIYYRRN